MAEEQEEVGNKSQMRTSRKSLSFQNKLVSLKRWYNIGPASNDRGVF